MTRQSSLSDTVLTYTWYSGSITISPHIHSQEGPNRNAKLYDRRQWAGWKTPCCFMVNGETPIRSSLRGLWFWDLGKKTSGKKTDRSRSRSGGEPEAESWVWWVPRGGAAEVCFPNTDRGWRLAVCEEDLALHVLWLPWQLGCWDAFQENLPPGLLAQVSCSELIWAHLNRPWWPFSVGFSTLAAHENHPLSPAPAFWFTRKNVSKVFWNQVSKAWFTLDEEIIACFNIFFLVVYHIFQNFCSEQIFLM